MYDSRESGRLIGYETNIDQLVHHAGLYTARILAGSKPPDLPVIPPTKFELVINLKNGQGAGHHRAATLLAHADEVVE